MKTIKFSLPSGECFAKVPDDKGKSFQYCGGKEVDESNSNDSYTGFIINKGKKGQFTICIPMSFYQEFAENLASKKEDKEEG